jgi:hypothetical protein
MAILRKSEIIIRKDKQGNEIVVRTGNTVHIPLPGDVEREPFLWSKTDKEKLKLKQAKSEFKKHPTSAKILSESTFALEENKLLAFIKVLPESKRLISHNGRKHHGRRKRTYKKFLKSLLNEKNILLSN